MSILGDVTSQIGKQKFLPNQHLGHENETFRVLRNRDSDQENRG